MNSGQLTLIRAVATAAISALAVLTTYYPNDVWFTAAIAAASAIGIHAIPSISQTSSDLVPQMEVPKMSTGPELMGIVPVSPTPVEAPEATPEAETPETPPEATPEAEAPEGARTAPVDPKNRVLAAVDALVEAVKNL